METALLEISKIAGIFTLAFFSFWPAIPAGLALGLNPLTVIATTTLSYAAGVGVVVFLGDNIRAWFMRRYGQQAAGQSDGRLARIWEKYGMVGLGLAAPMTVGAQIGAIVGLALNAAPRRLFVALSFGALVWSIGLTLACVAGILGVQAVAN